MIFLQRVYKVGRVYPHCTRCVPTLLFLWVICSTPLASNARCQLRLEAEAQRTLEGVGWTPWFGWDTSWACRWDVPYLTHPYAPAPPYWITSSAWKRTAVGIVRPSALAVLRLMTSSNLVGCSMGRSPGLAPLRMRST